MHRPPRSSNSASGPKWKNGNGSWKSDFPYLPLGEARGGLGGLKLDEIDAANSSPMLPMARRSGAPFGAAVWVTVAFWPQGVFLALAREPPPPNGPGCYGISK